MSLEGVLSDQDLRVAIETDQRPHLLGAFLTDSEASLICVGILFPFFPSFVSSLHDASLLPLAAGAPHLHQHPPPPRL